MQLLGEVKLYAQQLGTPVYTAITATSAAASADNAAGEYWLCAIGCDMTVRINASGVTTAAVWLTAPGIFLPAGALVPVKLSQAMRLVGIAYTGCSGTLMALPVTE